jgi:hypothetical protein
MGNHGVFSWKWAIDLALTRSHGGARSPGLGSLPAASEDCWGIGVKGGLQGGETGDAMGRVGERGWQAVNGFRGAVGIG